MHSKIYQFSKQPIVKDEYINVDNISTDNSQMVTVDYAQEIDSEFRKDLIEEFVKMILPKGMFALEGENTLIYQGGFTEWRKEYVNLIKAKAEEVTPGNVMEWIGPAYALQKAIVNPLNTDVLFIMEYGKEYAYAERSRGFMDFVSRLEKGDKLYIGSILDYHY